MAVDKRFLKEVEAEIGPGKRKPFHEVISKDEIEALRQEGYSVKRIAGLYGCSMTTIYDILNPTTNVRRQANRNAYHRAAVAKARSDTDTSDPIGMFMDRIWDWVSG